MKLARLVAIPLTLLATASASAHQAYDYPTHDRVEYVFDCMQKNGGINYDNLYKCSCSIDYIASKMTYKEFVTADTFVRGAHAMGERPEVLREGELAESQRASLEDIQNQAAKHCFLPVQADAEGGEPEGDDD
jgi:hypothetical protein